MSSFKSLVQRELVSVFIVPEKGRKGKKQKKKTGAVPFHSFSTPILELMVVFYLVSVLYFFEGNGGMLVSISKSTTKKKTKKKEKKIFFFI